MNRGLTRLGFTALSLVVGQAYVSAQTVTTGKMGGTIVDASGQPVTGANVRATSAQITRVATTDAEGKFSFSLLNGGTWQVHVTKAGYVAQAQTVVVNVNSATTANFKIAKESGVTVEVVSSFTNIDQTSTTTGANFGMDNVQSIPKGRDITDIAMLTPGVTQSGFGGGQGLGISMSGASGAENSFSIDGLTTNDMRYGGAGANLVTEFVDQVDVQTGGFKPEYSALGGVFNVLTKSGSNNFAGTAWFTMTPGSLTPAPKRNLYVQEDKAITRSDIGIWVGGALITDKLFYSLGINSDRTNTPSSLNNSGLSIASTTNNALQLFAKFNYYLNLDNQLTFSYFGTPSKRTQGDTNTPNTVGDGRGTANTAATFENKTNNYSLIWDSVITPTMNLSAKIGQAKIDNTVDPNNKTDFLLHDTLWDSPAGGPYAVDLYYSRGGYGLVVNEHNKTTQASLDLNWVVFGNHGLKIGYSTLQSEYALEEHYTGGRRMVIDMRAGVPRLRERIIRNDATVKADFSAFYAQDTWQVSPALNVFYGFRAEKQDQKDARGNTFLKFDMGKYIQPRVGFTWDVVGKGLSKFSGSYGRYYERVPQRMAIREFGGEYFVENRYGGGYAGSNFTYNRNAANMIGTYGGTPTQIDYAASFNNPPIVDDLKLPQRDEVQLGFEQQVTNEIRLGIQGRYRKLTNPIEDSVLTDATGDNTYDSNGMAIIWNPKGGPVSWKDSGTGQKVTVANTLFPEAYNTYKAVDLTFEYKTSTTFLKAIYTWSRLEGNYEGLISGSNGQADANITASYDYYPYVGEGLLPLDRTHQFKLYGYRSFQVANNPLNVGFNFVWQSGIPISWWDDGSTSNPIRPDIGGYGDGTPKNGKLGDQGRTPSHGQLDISIDYTFPLSKRVKLSPMIDVFNLLNSRTTATVLEQASDAGGTFYPAGKWSSATSWYNPRTIRFGAKLRF